MLPRRFPPPWSVEELDACFVVRDDNAAKARVIYFEDERGRPLRSRFCSVTPSRIAAPISGALCRGNSLNASRCSTATSSISCHVRFASRQRRRARFASLRTIITPTNMPNTKAPYAAHTVIGSIVILLNNRVGSNCGGAYETFARGPHIQHRSRAQT